MGDSCDELACAICFESVSESIDLPCTCKVPYCLQCWDRALAQSFNHCGKSRCPTCRSPVHVEFDRARARLKFSLTSESIGGGGAEIPGERAVPGIGDEDVAPSPFVDRIGEQTRPVQIQMLQRHGEAHGEAHPILQEIVQDQQALLCKMSISELKSRISVAGGSIDGCVEKWDLIERLLDVLGEQDNAVATPPCVCGGALFRMNGLARAQITVEKTLAQRGLQTGTSAYKQAFQEELQQVARNGDCGVICDLCGKTVPFTSGVWTCRNDDRTILHPTSYDVCDSCFVCLTCHGTDCFVQVGCSKVKATKAGQRALSPEKVKVQLFEPLYGQGYYFTLGLVLVALVMLLHLVLKLLRRSRRRAQRWQQPLISVYAHPAPVLPNV